MNRSKSRPLRYGFAVLTAIAAIASGRIPIIGEGLVGFILFSVMLSAWYGGRGPGLTATAVIMATVLLTVVGSSVSPSQVAGWVMFVALGVAITLLVESLHTARRRAEASEKWLSAVLTSIGDAVIATDRQGVVVFMNPEAEARTGWSESEANGKKLVEVFSIVNETTRRPVKNPAATVLAEGRVVGLANHTVLIARNGTETPIDDSAAPITDRQGGIQGVVLVFRDVSEKRKTEELRERLAAIVESSNDAVISLNLDGVVTSWNKAAELIFDYRADEVVGKYVSMLMPETHAEEMTTILAQVRRGERVHHYETTRRRKDGTAVDVSLSVSPIRDGYGEIIGAAKVGRDITERKRVEQERKEADRRKDEFLAMLAHEIRNPIAAIANAVALTNQAGVEEHYAWAVEVVNRQIGILGRLIDDLLDVSRITRGKIRLLKESIDARLVIENALESVRPLIEERDQRFETEIPAEPLPLEVDPVRFEQILVNLLTNAAKYTEAGGRIRFSAERLDGEIVFRVEDSGIGISPREIPRMFELFVQGECALRGRSEGGLGIGLTIVKSLVEMHGGTVSAESVGPGQGSSFLVRLPENRPVQSRERARCRPIPASTRSPRVLIIDDNKDLADGLAKNLRFYGYEVATTHDGPEGIEAARTLHPGVILLDIGLPTLDGYQVVRTLRNEARLSDVLIIAISGYGQEEDVKRSRDAGINHHMVKPLDLVALTNLLTLPS